MTRAPRAVRRNVPPGSGHQPVYAASPGPPPHLDRARCLPGNSFLPPSAWSADAPPEEQEAACFVCGTCPAFGACSSWFDSLPKSARPSGIVAGRMRGAPRPWPERPAPARVPEEAPAAPQHAAADPATLAVGERRRQRDRARYANASDATREKARARARVKSRAYRRRLKDERRADG